MIISKLSSFDISLGSWISLLLLQKQKYERLGWLGLWHPKERQFLGICKCLRSWVGPQCAGNQNLSYERWNLNVPLSPKTFLALIRIWEDLIESFIANLQKDAKGETSKSLLTWALPSQVWYMALFVIWSHFLIIQYEFPDTMGGNQACQSPTTDKIQSNDVSCGSSGDESDSVVDVTSQYNRLSAHF